MKVSIQSFRIFVDRLDDRAIEFMRNHSIFILRISIAIVFIWFGMLKVIGRSPVEDLVVAIVPWVPGRIFVPFLGIWENVIGLGLLFGAGLRLTIILLWLQQAGTFLTLIVRPDLAFQGGNPLLLTIAGEFFINNLILISGSLVIGSTLQSRKKKDLRKKK